MKNKSNIFILKIIILIYINLLNFDNDYECLLFSHNKQIFQISNFSNNSNYYDRVDQNEPL